MTLPAPPDGFAIRPPTMADVDAVVDLLRADEATAGGAPYTAVGDIRSDWNRPSMDLEQDAVVVIDGERVIAYADHSDGRARIGVHPDAHGRGIGGWLRAWSEAQVRRQGHPRIGQTIGDADTAATELLTAAGYTSRWESWVFSIDLDDALPVPELPAGMVLRPMVRPQEDAAVHRVVEDAFSEWPDRDSGTSFEDWRASNLDRDDAEVLVVVEGDAIIGAAVCLDEGEGEGWVEQLAVASSHRGRGLARALLHGAFRAFRERGCTTSGLSTDSRTGARTLYEHVGMAVTESFTRWSRDLDA